MADGVQIKVCQQEIVKLDLQIRAFIQDIRECIGPLELLHDLNQDVREKIQETKDRIQELERVAKEQDKETDKIAILKDVDNHRKQLSSSQMSLRKANLACHVAIERREKQQLLEEPTELRHRNTSEKESVAKTASNVTESLMTLSRTMATYVTQGEQTITTLVSSSKQIDETHDEFKSMSGHIQNSRRLLTKYGRRECTDKLLIFLALVFFFATVLYIVKRRVFSASGTEG